MTPILAPDSNELDRLRAMRDALVDLLHTGHVDADAVRAVIDRAK